MDEIEALAYKCRVAKPSDTVVHSECAFTFFTPFSNERGIMVNLHTFAGTVPELTCTTSDNKEIFVRIVKNRVAKEVTSDDAPTKLALGVEGGFATDDDKYQVITHHSIVVLDGSGEVLAERPYDETSKSLFSEAVVASVESIIHHAGLAVQQDLTAWQDDEEIPVTKYFDNLPFVENGVTISPDPKNWKCQKSGATENLWLNLSDGYIGGGRKNWDGSGGSNGALDHFIDTGEKYPLVVKLGTITTEGSTVHADCFSYAQDENGPVKIPNLVELLAKRGIQVAVLEKTEKSTAELEVELNANYAFDAITESGANLVPVTGPGFQGLQNLGNSCYLNSVVQVLAAIPELVTTYGSRKPTEHELFEGVTLQNAPHDLIVQTVKLITALTSGAYSIPNDELDAGHLTDPKYRVVPRMFKHLIGKDHVDFRTGQQQDAAQFLQYMLEKLDESEMKNEKIKTRTSLFFSFETQDRLVCSADDKVKYTSRAAETVWSLRIPMEKAKIIPKVDEEPEPKKQKQDGQEDKDGEKPVPTIGFMDCVESWASECPLEDYRWPHLSDVVHPGTQTTRFINFPRYLWVQIQRYQLGPDWLPYKLEVNLDISEEIDLSPLKAVGPQEGETLIPDVSKPASRTSQDNGLSEVALGQLLDMGFGLNGSKRALVAVGGSNFEAAMNWIFEHSMDPDFNDPLPEEGDATPSKSTEADDAIVQSLTDSLGCFTIDQVRAALKETDGAPDRAADWLFSHMDDLDNAIASLSKSKNEPHANSTEKIQLEDGDGHYQMVGMISHIGKNTGSGHYVAHVKRDGKWVIYNDEKVALSENPPFQHGYLYLFRRSDTMGSPNPN